MEHRQGCFFKLLARAEVIGKEAVENGGWITFEPPLGNRSWFLLQLLLSLINFNCSMRSWVVVRSGWMMELASQHTTHGRSTLRSAFNLP